MSSDLPLSDSTSDLLAGLVDEYVSRLRAGADPSVDEYVEKYPHLAADIRDIFPMLGFMEHVGDDSASRSTLAAKEEFTSLLPRTQLGDYRIIGEIGRGGMGVVYQAEHTTLRRRVALKILPHRGPDHVPKERFYREARAAAKLHHTNIVPVFDFGEDEGVPYYAMQFIDGHGLDELVAWVREHEGDLSSGSISGFWKDFGGQPDGGSSNSDVTGLRRWRYIAGLGMQAAQALAYAHEQGVVHRDVKPSNLILDQNHHLWITDFGLAKVNDDKDLTVSGHLIGTLRYLPPEAIHGESGELGDVYGLGLVLYELVALRRPFDDSSHLALIRKIVEKGPVPIEQERADVPRDLRIIIHKAMDRDPSSRYASADALADDLRRFIEDKPILARPHSLATNVWRWARRNRLAATLISTVALLILVGFLASTLFAVNLNKVVKERSAALSAASRERQTASQERDAALQRLFAANLAEAAALRSSGQLGQRFGAIRAIQNAAALLPKIDRDPLAKFQLRSELIGAVGFADAEIQHEWTDTTVERYGFDYHAGIQCVAIADRWQKELLVKNAETEDVVLRSKSFQRPAYPMISPNGRWVACLDWRQDVKELVVFELATKNEYHRQAVSQSDFSFDAGDHVAFLDSTGAAVVYDLDQQQETARLELADQAARIGLSRDASRIAVVFSKSPHTIRAWELASDELIFEQNNQEFAHDITWNAAGTEIAVAANFGLGVWDIQSGRRKFDMPHTGTVFHLAYSVDGEILISSTWGHSASVWDTNRGEKILQLSGTLGWSNVVGHDGRLAIHRGNQLSFCRFATGSERKVILPSQKTNDLAAPRNSVVHPNGRLVALATNYGVRLADAVTGTQHEDMVLGYTASVCFNSDGREMLTCDGYQVRVWSVALEPGSSLVTSIGPPQLLELPDAFQGQAIYMFVVADGHQVVISSKAWMCILDGRAASAAPQMFKIPEFARSVCYNQKLVATPNSKNWLMYHYERQHEVAKIDKPINLTRGHFSPNGQQLFIVGDNVVKAYSVPSCRLSYSIRDVDVAQTLSFSPDGEIAFLVLRSPPGTLLIESKTGCRLAHFPTSPEAVPRDVPSRWIPSSNRLVTFGRFNELVSWDLNSVRQQLADVNLDWDRRWLPPPSAVPATNATADRTRLTIDWGGQRRQLMENLITRERESALVELSSELLEQTPDDVDLLVVRAQAHLMTKNNEAARRDLERALSLNPDDQQSLALLAQLDADSTEATLDDAN